jgi:hypothetical protein
MNCGVSSHAPDCLCDVIITHPVEVKHDLCLDDYEYGRDVAAYLNIEFVPSEDDLLDVFDHLARLRDALRVVDASKLDELEAEKPEHRTNFGEAEGFRKVRANTKGSIAFVKSLANAPLSNGELRAETNRIFGTNISPSHMNHMRKRYGMAVSL